MMGGIVRLKEGSWVAAAGGTGHLQPPPCGPTRLTDSLPIQPTPPTPCPQFWVHAAPLPSGPSTLEIEAENGAKLTTSCDNPLQEQELPNFQSPEQ